MCNTFNPFNFVLFSPIQLVNIYIPDITSRSGKVCGVKVEKGGEKVEIIAPIIISRDYTQLNWRKFGKYIEISRFILICLFCLNSTPLQYLVLKIFTFWYVLL